MRKTTKDTLIKAGEAVAGILLASFVLAWLVGSLVGKEVFGAPAADISEYEFSRDEVVVPEYDLSEEAVKITVHLVYSHAELMGEFMKQAGYMPPPELVAFSIPHGRQCHIWVGVPLYYNSQVWYTWGHELGHCIFGKWHKNDLPKEGKL